MCRDAFFLNFFFSFTVYGKAFEFYDMVPSVKKLDAKLHIYLVFLWHWKILSYESVYSLPFSSHGTLACIITYGVINFSCQPINFIPGLINWNYVVVFQYLVN